MRFSMIEPSAGPLEGSLSYVESDHAFNFIPGTREALLARAGEAGTTSLSIGTLQIEVAVQTGIVLFVWGYLPKLHWKTGRVDVTSMVPGTVRVVDPPVFESGVSIDISSSDPTITHDASTGWILVSVQAGFPTGTKVLVASNTVLCLSEGELNSIFLHPEFY